MEFSSTEPRLSSYLHARACRSGTPLAGNFELTARCNFNCKMCYVHLTAEEQQRRGRELTADEWLAIAQEARSRGMLFLLLTIPVYLHRRRAADPQGFPLFADGAEENGDVGVSEQQRVPYRPGLAGLFPARSAVPLQHHPLRGQRCRL